MLLLGSATPGATAPSQLSSPCSLLFTSGNWLSQTVFPALPAEAAQTARVPVAGRLATINQLPATTDEFSRVFSTAKVTATDRQQMADAAAYLKSLGMGRGLTEITAKTFDEFLQKTDATWVAIIGHNEGGEFRFLDGSTEHIALLERSCSLRGKLCIFISCNSRDYIETDSRLGMSRELTLKEGLYVAHRLNSIIGASTSQLSIVDVANQVARVSRNANIRFHVAYLALKGCGAMGTSIAVGLVIHSAECLDRKRGCSTGK